MYIAFALFTIGGSLLLVAGIVLLIRSSYSFRMALVPEAPDTICRVAMNQNSVFKAVCAVLVCTYERYLGAVGETYVLENYEHEIQAAERKRQIAGLDLSCGHIAE